MQFRQLVLGAALVATTAIVAPSPARSASDTVVQLDYRTSEQSGCVAEADLRRMVIEQLGHDPFRADGDRRVTVTLSRTEGGFQGRIAWTDVRGRPLGDRVLWSRSRDCREITANVAFAVALQLQLVERGAPMEGNAATAAPVPPLKNGDGSGRAGPPPDRSAASPESPPAVAAPEPAAPDRERGPRPEAERPPPGASPPVVPGDESAGGLRLAVGLGPAIGVGMLPSPTAFGRLFVAARLRRYSAEVAGDAALPATLTQRDDSAVVLNALGSTAAGCAHLSAASACLLARFGWLRARGTGVDRPATSWGRFGEVGLRVAASRELGRFTLSLRGDGLVLLSRQNVLLNETVVWRVPRFGGLVGLDVSLRFF